MSELEEKRQRKAEVREGFLLKLKERVRRKLSREREPDESLPPLGSFIAAAERYGVRGLNYERLEDGSEMLTQNKGEGWKALGADWTLFIGLTPEGQGPHHNTVLSDEESSQGISVGGNGKISKDHPVAVLASKLKEQGKDIQVNLIGSHTDWRKRDSGDQILGTKLLIDEHGNLIGNIPVDQEMKVMIEGAQFRWFDGPEGGKQSLILEHSEE